ncbi:dermonecrotic toxin domain-containing protein [Pseudomonas sp. E102]|uniref:dermonecrotic toxin domain-containing protein n=1 Tax=Pseudomonas sp. E102 TaxID=181579 RepID=UPI0040455E94
MKLLDDNQVKLARLFAGLPTFDTVLNNLLVNTLRKKIPERKFRPALLENIQPDHWHVNHFTLDPNGVGALTRSQSFTEVMRSSLATDSPPTYTAGGVGFYTRPDAVDEADSVFYSPPDSKILRAMESVFYVADPTTNESVKQQLRDDLGRFRDSKNWGHALDATEPLTAQAAFAHLLSKRFLHFFNLYKADRKPAASSNQSARTQQAEDDRLLDIITTHPDKADRNRLLRAPIPHVYAVMLDMGSATPQPWPAAMVIKHTDQPWLFLYSLEGGLQRFGSFQAMAAVVTPLYNGHKRTIANIACELSGHVFEGAALALLAQQSAALETVLGTPSDGTLTLKAFVQQVEDALALPVLSLDGPLAVRRHTRVENNRPAFYAAATLSEQANYRRLESRVYEAVFGLAGRVPTLQQFTRQKIQAYLQQTLHPTLEPDPDRTQVTLSFGEKANPRESRTVSLTQLILDNLRPPQYGEAMNEVSTFHLVDQRCQRITHPDTGLAITLTGPELARMTTSIDAGGNYEILLRKEMNTPQYKAAWRAAYLANLKFKCHEARLRGDVFKAPGLDQTGKLSNLQKQIPLWLGAVLKSPTAEARGQVSGRRVQVHGLLLGGSVAAGGQQGTMGNALSVDGALIFSDQLGPEIKGPVGVYFPDSPDGDDIQEFSDLSDGVGQLLLQEKWQAYFRSRISAPDPDELKGSLAQRRGRPLVRGSLIAGDLLEALHRAHVQFHSAHANHQSNSNRDVQRHHAARVFMMAVDILMDVAGMLLVPGFQLLKRAVRTGSFVLRSGVVPTDFNTLVFVDQVANRLGQGGARGWATPSRGQASFLALMARQQADEALAGLPLEQAIYHRFAVKDTSSIQGLTPDAQGFYRPKLSTDSTAKVYVRQPDGTVFRVHDHTKLSASEATLVDPTTGLSIRSSGVMRNTVARMSNGEWRAVGFGLGGGGKRPAKTPPQPGPSKRPAPSSPTDSGLIRTAGSWNNDYGDLVPYIATRLPSWPQNRSLLVIDQVTAGQSRSIRFTPGADEVFYPGSAHPQASGTDIVLRRTGGNHYSLIQDDLIVEIAADGNCLFNALAVGLNAGQPQATFTMQGLRDAVGDYIDQHPEVSDFVPRISALQLALVENAPRLKDLLGKVALFDLAQIVSEAVNPHNLFQPALSYLRAFANATASRVFEREYSNLLPEMLRHIGRFVSPRPPGPLLRTNSSPFYTVGDQVLKRFFKDILLGPIEDREIEELINNEHLMLSQDVMHAMLEYGVRARELTDHHPRNHDAYVRYDPNVHDRLSDDDDLLDEVYLVDEDDLKFAQRRIKQDTGKIVSDEAELFSRYIYYDKVEAFVDFYEVILQRFPDLLRRARILLSSQVVSYHLSGMLPLNVVARWVRDSSLTDARLQLIAAYANTRYEEMILTGNIDIQWMREFDDENVREILFHRQALVDFMKFIGGARGNIDDVDIPAVARLFSAPGERPSNSRVDILIHRPGILRTLQTMPGHSPALARSIWNDLVGPHYSDTNILATLRQPDVFRSEHGFVSDLSASLGAEPARANRIVMELLGVDQSLAQQYLYHFDFPVDRLGHSLLDFALYLQSNLAVPDWAWQYLRMGMTRESLKPFGEMRRKST